MKRFLGLRRVFRPDHGRRDVDDDVDAELAFHIETRIDDLIAAGASPAVARATAQQEFGNWQRIRTDCVTIDAQRQREVEIMELLESVWSDVRYGWRGLRRAPGFTLVAVLTMALGVGATTAIFSVVSAVLLRPLPYYAADRLVHIGEREVDQTGRGGTTSLDNYADWRTLNRSFDAMGIYSTGTPTLTGRGDPERVRIARVTAGIFDVFHITPLHGRAIDSTDFAMAAAPVVVVSYDYWRARLGGDPSLVGQTITLNLTPFTVVGILPPAFHAPGGLNKPLWINFRFDTSDGRGGRSKNVVARLREGVTRAQAQAEMTTISKRLAELYPLHNKGETAVVTPLSEIIFGSVRRPLLMLLGASALVLLIACANLSNLLLARGMSRSRELAVRAALGAARGRTIRQLLTESFVLSAFGAAVGLALAQVGTSALLRLAPAVVRDRPPSLDGRVLAFTMVLSVLTAILFGLFPAVRMARRDVQSALKESGSRVAGGQSTRARSMLAIAQLSLALTLLAGSSLVLKSFARVLDVDPGIRAENLMSASVTLPLSRYDSLRSTGFYHDLQQRLAASPGVQSAAVTSLVPFSGDFDRIGISKLNGEAERVGTDSPEGDRYIVSPSYFATMGIRTIEGRVLTRDDRFDGPVVCVVDEVFARRIFGGKAAIGRSMQLPMRREYATIVGIVSHVKTYGLDASSPGQIYMSNEQYPWRFMSVVVRTAGPPLAQAPTLARVVHAMDRDQPVADVASMEQLMATLLLSRRFTVTLLGVFAVVAVIVAAVGLYGVIAFGVTQRRREIGVRIALGAQRPQIAGMILREGAWIGVIGAAIGSLSAIAMGRALAGLLFEVSPRDPLVLGGVILLLVAVALVASWLPARRAARVSATEVLRGD